MRRVQKGDADAFDSLYDRHAATALRSSVVRDRGRAEDAVQDGFLAIWRSRGAYRPEAGSVQGWARAIIRHRAIDAARRQKAGVAMATDGANLPDASGPSSMHDHAIERERSDTLLASLADLPEAQAEVIVLAFYGECSHSEIARLLALPPGTVKGRMRLGLEKLRNDLEAGSG